MKISYLATHLFHVQIELDYFYQIHISHQNSEDRTNHLIQNSVHNPHTHTLE